MIVTYFVNRLWFDGSNHRTEYSYSNYKWRNELAVIIGLCYILPDMSWRVQASKENSHKFAEFVVRDGKNIIAFTNGYISKNDKSVLILKQLHSDVSGDGLGTRLLMNIGLWAKKQGAIELNGDFRPTGDREMIMRWYFNRGIYIVNGGFNLSGSIPQIILACTARLALYK